MLGLHKQSNVGVARNNSCVGLLKQWIVVIEEALGCWNCQSNLNIAVANANGFAELKKQSIFGMTEASGCWDY